MENNKKTMDKIVALCKTRGFIFPGSEIYGGLANSWDYGPLGVEFKNNVKRAWWKKFVQEWSPRRGLRPLAETSCSAPRGFLRKARLNHWDCVGGGGQRGN